jgi:glycosyltransferase involved in cell wall biosynthesis
MPKKPKLLWCGDIAAKTGFARVTENVLPYLSKKFNIVVLANNWWGDPNPLQKKYKMYPSSNRFQTAPFGENRIREIVQAEAPDLVFTINDMWIINEQYRQIKDFHKKKKFKFIGYSPMDSYGWVGCLDETANDWDGVISYTQFGAYEFIQGGITKPIAVIPHGVTPGQFYPVDKNKARKELGLDENLFIVFNGNRNQFRKRIDITISAFAKFAVDKPNTKLYLHMGKKDQGWDVMQLFEREMKRNKLDANNRIILTSNCDGPPSVELETLNTIYNAADVGINTCKGEGWGLVSFEQAACKIAQVVPGHTSCKEIFEGYGQLIRCDHIDTDTNYGREMPCPSTEHLVEILNDLYKNPKKLEATAELCYERVLEKQFTWETIGSQFAGVFEDTIKGVDHSIKKVSPKKKIRKKRKIGNA